MRARAFIRFIYMLGRHRCIGEHFATIQNKTIVATIINEFDLELVDGHVPKRYSSIRPLCVYLTTRACIVTFPS